MSRLRLQRHSDTSCDHIHSVAAFARREGNQLWLQFRAIGDTDGIIWPSGRSDKHGWERKDGLWQHSCFEFFAAVQDEPRYFETNFATSNQWAAYDFIGYRSGMRTADDVEMVAAIPTVRKNRTELSARLIIPPAFVEKDWQANLTAILEAKDGTKSYWALAHAPGPPDFHNRDCFTLSLPAPEQP